MILLIIDKKCLSWIKKILYDFKKAKFRNK